MGKQPLYPHVPKSKSKARTFYAVHWWLADENDVREIDGVDTLEKALARAKKLAESGYGYHSFTLYAYHAKLVDDSFWIDGQFYPGQKWERVDDNFEESWDISGNRIK